MGRSIKIPHKIMSKLVVEESMVDVIRRYCFIKYCFTFVIVSVKLALSNSLIHVNLEHYVVSIHRWVIHSYIINPLWVQCMAMYPSYYYNKPMISGLMQKTLAIIALIVAGCTALEVVDVIFTMRLYSGLLP